MYNKNLQSKLSILALFAGILTAYNVGCDISDGDFSDTAQIEETIEKDVEEAYQVSIVNDVVTGTPAKIASLAKSFAPIVFGRIFDTTRTRKKGIVAVDRIEAGDTTAQATVTYRLFGEFRVTDLGLGVTVNKPFEHPIQRTITFAKRRPNARNKWVPTSISAAYGASVGGHIVIDTIRIITSTDTLIFSDPSDIIFYDRKALAFHANDSILIDVKAYNSQNLLDLPFGYVVNGRNRGTERFKGEFFRNGNGHYVRKIGIAGSADIFHQLVIDFVTTGTRSINVNKSYDSYLISIPYKVIP